MRAYADLYDIVEGSALVPFIEAELTNGTTCFARKLLTSIYADSFVEIARHSERMLLVLDTIESIAQHALLLPLLSRLPRQRNSIVNLLGVLARSVRRPCFEL